MHHLFTLSVLVGLFLVIAGACILIGFLTPGTILFVGLILVAGALSWLPRPGTSLIDSMVSAILSGCVLVALLLLGPGSFSVDAKLFGRREVIIRPQT